MFEIKLTGKDRAALETEINNLRADEFSEFIKTPDRQKILEKVISEAKEAMRFYDLAEKRNQAMMANTVSAMRREGKHVAALISGGHHTGGLTEIMKEKGLSYLVLMPKFFDDQSRPYVAILTKKTGPYRELATSGAYDLALEAYFDTGDLGELEEMMAFAVGQSAIAGKDIEAEIKAWIDSYEKAYGKVSPVRRDAVAEPIRPEDLKRRLAEIKVIGRGSQVCEVQVENNIYRVTSDQVQAVRIQGKETPREIKKRPTVVSKAFRTAIEELKASRFGLSNILGRLVLTWAVRSVYAKSGFSQKRGTDKGYAEKLSKMSHLLRYKFAPQYETVTLRNGVTVRLVYIPGRYKFEIDMAQRFSEKKPIFTSGHDRSGCPFCNINPEEVIDEVRYGNRNYYVAIQVAQFAPEHMLLISKDPLPQTLDENQIEDMAEFMSGISEGYEAVFNWVNPEKKSLARQHYHWQVYKADSSIWANYKKGILKTELLAKESTRNTYVGGLSNWICPAKIVRGKDIKEISKILCENIRKIEGHGKIPSIVFKLINGEFTFILYSRVVEEKPDSSRSIYGDSRMAREATERSGYVVAYTEEMFKTLKENPELIRTILNDSAGSTVAEQPHRRGPAAERNGLIPPLVLITAAGFARPELLIALTGIGAVVLLGVYIYRNFISGKFLRRRPPIAITGIDGFIGVNLANQAREKGIELTGLARDEKSPRLNKLLRDREDITIEEGDLLNPDYAVFSRLMKDNEVFYHLGAMASPQDCTRRPHEALIVNSLATAILARLAQRHGTRFIFASTYLCYNLMRRPRGALVKEEEAAMILKGDEPEIQDLRAWLDKCESLFDEYAENFILNQGEVEESPEEFVKSNIKIPVISEKRLGQLGLPKDYFYPLTKVLAERFVMKITEGMIVRFSNIYGPAQDEDYKVPLYILGKTSTDGGIIFKGIADLDPGETFEVWKHGARDCLPVKDCVKALLKAAEIRITEDSKVINIASGKPTTNSEIGRAITEAIGNKVSIKEGVREGEDIHVCDTARFRKYLHSEPTIPLAQGIRSALEYYRPDLQQPHRPWPPIAITGINGFTGVDLANQIREKVLEHYRPDLQQPQRHGSPIAITGINGFIGINLANKAREKGIELTGLARDKKSSRLNKLLRDREDITIEEGDLLNPDYAVFNRLMKDNEVFYHLGAMANPQDCARRPHEALIVNSLATAILAGLAQRHGTRFIFASTYLCYNLTRMPIGALVKEEEAAAILKGDEPEIQDLRAWLDKCESLFDKYAENFILNQGEVEESPEEFVKSNIKIPVISEKRLGQLGLPKDYFYPLTKVLAERFVMKITDGMIVRFSNIYGPAQDETYKIPLYILGKTSTDGEIIFKGIADFDRGETFEVWKHGARDYLPVEDCVEALLKAAEIRITEDSKVINIASGKPTTNIEIGRAITEAIGNKVLIKEGAREDKGVHVCDNARFKKYLHPEPTIPLARGMKSTLEYYRPDLQQPQRRGPAAERDGFIMPQIPIAVAGFARPELLIVLTGIGAVVLLGVYIYRYFISRQFLRRGPPITVTTATRICKTLNRFNVICGFSLNASKDPNDPRNASFKKGLEMFKTIFNLSSGKAPYSYEDQYRTEEEIARIEKEGLFSADKRTFHLREMHWNGKKYDFNLVNSDTAEIFGDKNSVLYRVVQRMKPEHISLHLGASSENVLYSAYTPYKSYDVAEGPVLERDVVLERIVKNIRVFQENLKAAGYDKPVLLETLNYVKTGAYEYVTDPDFIHEILERTGAHLLIDCSHLYVSARNRELSKPVGERSDDYMAYVRQIVNENTIERIDEIHLSVPDRNRTGDRTVGEYLDYHKPFYVNTEESRAIRQILRYILELREKNNVTKPVVVNFETSVDDSAEHVIALADTLEGMLTGQKTPRQPQPRDIMRMSREERLAIGNNNTDRYLELNYVRKHVGRVTGIARLIGEEIGLSEKLMTILMTAAEVHDGVYVDPDVYGRIEKYHGGKKLTSEQRKDYPTWDRFLAHLSKGKGRGLTPEEENVARDLYNHGERAVRNIKNLGIQVPLEVELLIRYHQYPSEFFKIQESFRGRLSCSAEELGLLLSILFTADVFENGNNVDKMKLFRDGRPHESFDQTFTFLERKHNEENIKNTRAMQALEKLIGERDRTLLSIVADARGTSELSEKDLEFIKAHRRGPPAGEEGFTLPGLLIALTGVGAAVFVGKYIFTKLVERLQLWRVKEDERLLSEVKRLVEKAKSLRNDATKKNAEIIDRLMDERENGPKQGDLEVKIDDRVKKIISTIFPHVYDKEFARSLKKKKFAIFQIDPEDEKNLPRRFVGDGIIERMPGFATVQPDEKGIRVNVYIIKGLCEAARENPHLLAQLITYNYDRYMKGKRSDERWIYSLGLSSQAAKELGISDLRKYDIDEAVESRDVEYLNSRLHSYQESPEKHELRRYIEGIIQKGDLINIIAGLRDKEEAAIQIEGYIKTLNFMISEREKKLKEIKLTPSWQSLEKLEQKAAEKEKELAERIREAELLKKQIDKKRRSIEPSIKQLDDIIGKIAGELEEHKNGRKGLYSNERNALRKKRAEMIEELAGVREIQNELLEAESFGKARSEKRKKAKPKARREKEKSGEGRKKFKYVNISGARSTFEIFAAIKKLEEEISEIERLLRNPRRLKEKIEAEKPDDQIKVFEQQLDRANREKQNYQAQFDTAQSRHDNAQKEVSSLEQEIVSLKREIDTQTKKTEDEEKKVKAEKERAEALKGRALKVQGDIYEVLKERFRAKSFFDRLMGCDPSHGFKAISGFGASIVTGGISFLSMFGVAIQHLMQGEFTGVTLAAVLSGLYFGWAAIRFLGIEFAMQGALRGYYAEYPDLKNHPDTPGMSNWQQLMEVEIARSDGYRHPAFAKLSSEVQKLVTLHEGFKSHFLGMIALMPVLGLFLGKRYETSRKKEILYGKARSDKLGDILEAASSEYTDIGELALRNISGIENIDTFLSILEIAPYGSTAKKIAYVRLLWKAQKMLQRPDPEIEDVAKILKSIRRNMSSSLREYMLSQKATEMLYENKIPEVIETLKTLRLEAIRNSSALSLHYYIKPPHAFTSLAARRAKWISLAASGISIAGGIFMLYIEHLAGAVTAGILLPIGGYIAVAGWRYFILERRVYNALVEEGLSPEEARIEAIARSGGYRHSAFNKLPLEGQRLITMHESFRNHFWGMFFILPLFYEGLLFARRDLLVKEMRSVRQRSFSGLAETLTQMRTKVTDEVKWENVGIDGAPELIKQYNTGRSRGTGRDKFQRRKGKKDRNLRGKTRKRWNFGPDWEDGLFPSQVEAETRENVGQGVVEKDYFYDVLEM
ncbi:MAG: DUF692 family multinuclear iron-containing protein, partial [Candidatus Omnitrophota bacterium]